MIINNIIFFPNSPKIPFWTITSPNKTEDVISHYNWFKRGDESKIFY